MAVSPQAGGAIDIVDLRKSFGGVDVLKGITIRASHGEFVSLVGPSGCGKTTTLNIVAGFEQADAGELRIGGDSMFAVPSHRRGLGMVFQNHALFPHMTISQNVGFGLAMRGVARETVATRVDEALALVRLSGFGARYPRELSGGQQQRVGIARALTVKPRAILMDEPLSSLDAKLRREMQTDLRLIQQEVGITALYVTHDQEEALTMSDKIVLMNRGTVEQEGRPEELYDQPASEFVAGFIGEATFFDARVTGRDGSAMTFAIEGLGEARASTASASAPNQLLRLAVRPSRVRLLPDDAPGGFAARILSRAFTGPGVRYVIDNGPAGSLLAEVAATGEAMPAPGDAVRWGVGVDGWMVFPAAAERP